MTALLGRARGVLLDFDGPICRLFAGHPAAAIAADLRRLLTEHGLTLRGDMAVEQDPIAVLRWTGRLGRKPLTRRIDNALTAAELAAVRSAEPTPYAREVIVAAHRAGKRLAVVSNNSPEACLAYLSAHRLEQYVGVVIGRPLAVPTRMKPDPAPVRAALTGLDARRQECVLIGDSVSDVEAARAAGVSVIGYANRRGKAEQLADADAVIESMADLLPMLG